MRVQGRPEDSLRLPSEENSKMIQFGETVEPLTTKSVISHFTISRSDQGKL